MENYLVIDGGGTFTKYALMDENAAILEKNKVPTPGYKDHKKEDYYRMLDGIAEQYRDRIAGIAMSLPGMLDSERGYCVTAGYLLRWRRSWKAGTDFRYPSKMTGNARLWQNFGRAA